MDANKQINRNGQQATKIFDDRTLQYDYRHLKEILTEGMIVLDVGCGTGAISKDVANLVGENGKVIGIDNTLDFIESGKNSYRDIRNLELTHIDLFDFHSVQKFDLIMSARVLQWLNNPEEALKKMKELLSIGGIISILDYNHEALVWEPEPPSSMIQFYDTFLKWRADAGMNNHIADDLGGMMEELELSNIEILNSDEHYDRNQGNFSSKVGIWSKVAGSTQMVEEGYLDNNLRLQAIREYDNWIEMKAQSMTMKLNEVRGRL